MAMTDDELEKLGQMASKAVWNTKLYSTYELRCDGRYDEIAKYQRINDIAIGKSLLLLTHENFAVEPKRKRGHHPDCPRYYTPAYARDRDCPFELCEMPGPESSRCGR